MVRKAQLKDIDVIFQLIEFYALQEKMLHCSWKEIVEHIDDYLVYECNRKIAGTCSLKYGWDHLVEIRSLAIHPNYYRRGFATEIVRECIDQAQQDLNADGIFALTYAVPFFLKLGFKTTLKSSLPLKIWEDCLGCLKQENCDEIAMFRSLKSVENKYPSFQIAPTL